MKSLVMFACCVLALTACGGGGTPKPQPKTLPIEGKVENLPEEAKGATVTATTSSGAELATATVNDDGTFDITLKEPTAAQLDIGSDGAALSAQAAVNGFDCDSLDVSDASARGTVVWEFGLSTGGYLRSASSAAVAANFEQPDLGTDGFFYIEFYMDKAVTLTGDNCFRKQGHNLDFSVTLDEGWNWVEFGWSGGEIGATSVSETDEEWFYTAE